MTQVTLQKSAESQPDELPIEILNPLKAAKQYSLRMYPPSTKLAPFVDHHWVLRWDLQGKQSFTCEVIPSPYINLTFMREGPRITGVTTGKYTYEVKGRGVIIGIKFHPGGFYPFYRKSVSELTDKAITASSVFSKADEPLNTTILSAQTDENAIAKLEDLLLNKHPTADKNLRLISDVMQLLKTDNSQTVHAVAQRLGMSERSLQEMFHTYVGVGPKWIMIRLRLQKAAKLAAKLESPNWAKVAIELGYTDQAHFVNDFKRIIGRSPTQYAAMVRRTKNDGATEMSTAGLQDLEHE